MDQKKIDRINELAKKARTPELLYRGLYTCTSL